MRKRGYLSWLSAIMLCGVMFFGEDDGASGAPDGDDGVNDGDVDDIEIDGEDESVSGDDDIPALSKEETIAARQLLEQNALQEKLTAVEKSIQTRIPEFNMQKTVAALKELYKTDPEKAEYYNASEAALEMYHRDHFGNVAKGDEINTGSHGGSTEMGDVLAKARGGDRRSTRKALAAAKA